MFTARKDVRVIMECLTKEILEAFSNVEEIPGFSVNVVQATLKKCFIE